MLAPMTRLSRSTLVLLLLLAGCADHGAPRTAPNRPGGGISEASVRAHLEFLASDAMNGRGSGTRDEQIAAEYVANHFRRVGLQPDASGQFVHTIDVERPTITSIPHLIAGDARWAHGGDIVITFLPIPSWSGPLQRLSGASDITAVRPGAVVFVPAAIDPETAARLFTAGARAILTPASAQVLARWDVLGKQPPALPAKPAIVDGVSIDQVARIALKPAAVDIVQRMPDGTVVRLEAEVEQPQRSQTWNAVGLLRGTNRTGQAILISAHLDHLGRRPAAAGQSDSIYNGADDDASGTAVVMALAEELAKRGRLERTLVFAAFGS